MSEARTTILNTIRRELARDPDLSAERLQESPEAAYVRIPRDYERTGKLTDDERMELFLDRLRDYDAELIFTGEADIPAAILQAMQDAGETLLLTPSGIPAAWLPQTGIEILRDHSLTIAELDRPTTVLTGCTVAIANSGTVLLSMARNRVAGPPPSCPTTISASSVAIRSSKLSPKPCLSLPATALPPSPPSPAPPPPATSK